MVEAEQRTNTARQIAQSAARRMNQLADAMDDGELDLTLGNDLIASIRSDLEAIETTIAEQRVVDYLAVEQHWSEKAERGTTYVVGVDIEGNTVVGRTGIHMHVHDWERVMTKERLMPMLDRLAASVDVFMLWEPEAMESASARAREMIAAFCDGSVGKHAAVAMAGASVSQMRAVIDHVKSCETCGNVTVVWIDIRDRGAFVEVDLEAEFGYVLALDAVQGTFVLAGAAGPGVVLNLAA